ASESQLCRRFSPTLLCTGEVETPDKNRGPTSTVLQQRACGRCLSILLGHASHNRCGTQVAHAATVCRKSVVAHSSYQRCRFERDQHESASAPSAPRSPSRNGRVSPVRRKAPT